MKAAWITDIHLNFISPNEATTFFESIVKDKPDFVFVTGDTSDSKRIIDDLYELERVVQRPVFFILGNHDYWGGDFVGVEAKIATKTSGSNYLRYLTRSSFHRLSRNTCVVGHDGWYDMLYGDHVTSPIELNDWVYINDFVNGRYIDIQHVVEVSRKRAQEAVIHVADCIKDAVRGGMKHIIVLTHVPPFTQTCTYRGQPSDKNFLPFFSSKLMGDTLLAASRAYPGVRFDVYAGHTHGEAHLDIDNLHVTVGESEYRFPKVQPLIEFD